MAVAMRRLAPVAHLPWGWGVGRQREVAPLLATLIPPPPAPVLSSGRGVEALVLAILAGPPALYKVGRRWDERGLFPVLPPGLEAPAGHDTR